jgi:hypothetical protein
MVFTKSSISLSSAHWRVERLTSKSRERDNARVNDERRGFVLVSADAGLGHPSLAREEIALALHAPLRNARQGRRRGVAGKV